MKAAKAHESLLFCLGLALEMHQAEAKHLTAKVDRDVIVHGCTRSYFDILVLA